jgi:hypothetical protein
MMLVVGSYKQSLIGIIYLGLLSLLFKEQFKNEFAYQWQIVLLHNILDEPFI